MPPAGSPTEMGWILGVDTGAKGALALVDFDKQDCRFVDMAKDGDSILTPGVVDEIQTLRETAPEALVIVEKVHAFPGQSAKTTWAQACMYSQALFVVREGWGLYSTVAPITWKKRLGLIAPKGSSPTQKKQISLEAARAWWPWVEGIHLAKHDGRCDALLIAYYHLLTTGET